MNNDMAGSLIVAILILIVVAVIGALATAAIMGTFSSDVSKQGNANQASTASSIHLYIGGPANAHPEFLNLVTDYQNRHPGIVIDVQDGGSGASIAAVGQNIADIGASSDALSTAQMQTYPNLRSYPVGASAVVWIVNNATGFQKLTWTSKGDLINFIKGTDTQLRNSDPPITTLVLPFDASGTESTASMYTTESNDHAFDNIGISTKAMNGNAGVLAEIQSDTTGREIGFIDLGYFLDSNNNVQRGATNVRPLSLDGYTITTYAQLRADSLTSLKNKIAGVPAKSSDYPQALTSPLIYVTNGAPNSLVKDFITYAQLRSGFLDVLAAGG